MNEDKLIDLFSSLTPTPPADVVVDNGDDAAAIRSNDQTVVVSTDTLFENVHFDLRYSSLSHAGQKLVAVNVSDIGAMGAKPRHILLSFGFPSPLKKSQASALAGGIKIACTQYGLHVLGGNVSQAAQFVLGATVLGSAAPGRLVRREGASANDTLWVTGTLGDAKAGYEALAQGLDCPLLIARQRVPEPPVALGLALAQQSLVTAMCDLSDGLARDLRSLCTASRLGATVKSDRIPISEALRSFTAEPLPYAINGGEEYGLLFCARPDNGPRIESLAREFGVVVQNIGRMSEAPEITVRDSQKTTPLPIGFLHQF